MLTGAVFVQANLTLVQRGARLRTVTDRLGSAGDAHSCRASQGAPLLYIWLSPFKLENSPAVVRGWRNAMPTEGVAVVFVKLSDLAFEAQLEAH